MTPTHAETVEQRAREAALELWGWMDPEDEGIRKSIAQGYLAGARRESALAAVAEIEKLVPLTCWHCRRGSALGADFRHETGTESWMTAMCLAEPLHAALLRLRAEAGDVAKEKA